MRTVTKRALALMLAASLHVAVGGAQTRDLTPRDMQDSALFRSRPGAKRRAARRYRKTAGPATPADAGEIGVTFWRLRPSEAGDPVGSRDVVHEPGGAAVTLTPERTPGDPELALGERFRFAVESSRPGYLYVVDRPVYDDGKPRDPTLIFPTRRLRGGANEMTGGRLVELPAVTDDPPYFTVAGRPGARLVADEVVVLLTPKPLDLEPGDGPLALTNERVAEWERLWGAAAAERFEYAGGDARDVTAEERAARRDPGYRLTRGGPSPQVIFRVPAGADDPLLVRVTIRVRAGRAGA